ncbi:MAG: hypothetical protein IID45_00745 [Planctomycetes bacterium]|nr:hypothetical protein [Planctomycetota bacterium]
MGTALVLAVFLFPGPDDIVLDRPAPQLLVGRPFRIALTIKTTASWKNASLRYILRRLSQLTKIGIVLDRRIDPTQKPFISVKSVALIDVLKTIAKKTSAQTAIIGNVVYIGPPEAVAALRSEMKKRTAELQRLTRRMPRRRRLSLLRKRSLYWNDLDSPAMLLKNQAAKYQLKILGKRNIPHDLWAAAAIPTASCVELLSLILIQYDLTFRWGRRGASIQLVPIGKNDDGSIGNNSSRN